MKKPYQMESHGAVKQLAEMATAGNVGRGPGVGWGAQPAAAGKGDHWVG